MGVHPHPPHLSQAPFDLFRDPEKEGSRALTAREQICMENRVRFTDTSPCPRSYSRLGQRIDFFRRAFGSQPMSELQAMAAVSVGIDIQVQSTASDRSLSNPSDCVDAPQSEVDAWLIVNRHEFGLNCAQVKLIGLCS